MRDSNYFCFLTAICAITAMVKISKGSWLPGCYSVWDLNRLYEEAAETGTYDDIPSCFCDNSTDFTVDGVQVSCLFGSSMDHLAGVLDSVHAAELQVSNIHMSHVNLGPSNTIPSRFFQMHNASPHTLIITACPGRENVTIEDGAFNGMEENLTHLVINDCQLPEVPAAINNLTSLTFLEIRYSLGRVQSEAFSSLTNLKHLNISENYLHSLETGSLTGLDMLETLVLGPKNYFNETLFPELRKVATLKSLSLQNTQMENIPDSGFTGLNSLERLIFTGNNIVNLTSQSFAGLYGLKHLDLRVNLIESIESSTFTPLTNLEELNLAGNYIDELSEEFFASLGSLKSLDVGWNELHEIPDNVFQSLSKLDSLDLRHNLKLTNLSENAFNGLSKLTHLNISLTNLTELKDGTLAPLTNLERLVLTGSPLLSLSTNLFESNSKLKQLALNQTEISTLPEGVFDSLVSLERIDLSGNPWLCDQELAPTINWIFSSLYTAAERSTPFFIDNSNLTYCNRPYSRRGELLLDLDVQSLTAYDPDLDTTTGAATTQEYTMEYTTPSSYDDFTQDYVDVDGNSVTADNSWSIPEPEHIPSDYSDQDNSNSAPEPHGDHSGHNAAAEGTEPEGSERPGKATLGIIVAVIIAGLLSVVVIGVIVFAMKRRKENSGNFTTPPDPGSTEMVQKEPTTRVVPAEADIIRDEPVSTPTTESQNGDYKNHGYV